MLTIGLAPGAAAKGSHQCCGGLNCRASRRRLAASAKITFLDKKKTESPRSETLARACCKSGFSLESGRAGRFVSDPQILCRFFNFFIACE
jgi:hypothetical protein